MPQPAPPGQPVQVPPRRAPVLLLLAVGLFAVATATAAAYLLTS